MAVHHVGGGKAPFGAGDPAATRRLGALPRLLRIALRMLLESDRRTFVLGVGLQTAAGVGFAMQLLVANGLLRRLLVPDVGRSDLPALIGLLGISGVLIAGLSFAAAAQAGVRKLLGERVVRHVQRLILDTASAVDVVEFQDPDFYDRLQRAQQQGVPTPLMISGALLEATAGTISTIGISIALAVINPILIPLVFIGAIPAWLAASTTSQELYSFSYGHTPNDRLRGALTEIVTGRDNADEVRAFDIYRYIRDRWETLYAERINEASVMIRRQLTRLGVASVASAAVTVGIFVLLTYLFVTGRSSLAAAATAALAVQQLGTRLIGLAGACSVVYENVLYLDDFDNFTRIHAGADKPAPTNASPATFKRITVNNVSFAYPHAERPALTNVSLHLNAGEIVALVGENGSGKTTLAKLLTGLYAPDRGTISWDDNDITTIDREAFRNAVGVIFQDFVRYPFSASDNVGVGNIKHMDDADAIAAAIDQAGARGIVDELPDGLDTILGKQFDGGTDLSVGQWQRIALARAFFRSAPLLVLDEPTAALDPRAERALFDSIYKLWSGRTALLISHRFSSVRAADRIVVLDRGEIIEQGTHEDLMNLKGRYAELFNLQADAYLDGHTQRRREEAASG